MSTAPTHEETTILNQEATSFGGYEILAEVARGGMGVVYKARQLSLDRVVALKLVLSGSNASESELRRFQVEAKAAARLDHPHIVPVYEIGEHEGQHFFSMGFVDGPSLSARLKQNGPLPPREVAEILRKVAEAVDYAHRQGVIHRDLQPDNVLMTPTGEPKVTNFGLAKRLDSEQSLTATGQVFGTPAYMSPEQTQGDRSVIGPATDIYSLGATLFAVLTGQPPFTLTVIHDLLIQVSEEPPPSLRTLNASVPAALEAICLKCLAKSPADRYPSAGALAEDLGRFLDSDRGNISRRNSAAKVGMWATAVAVVLIAGVWFGRQVLVSRSPDVTSATSPITQTVSAADEQLLRSLSAAQDALLPLPTGNLWKFRYADGAAACEQAFREFGFTLDQGTPTQLADSLKRRSPEFHESVICGLELWELCATAAQQMTAIEPLRQAQDALDTLDWRRSLRQARSDADVWNMFQKIRDALAESPTLAQIELLALLIGSRSPETHPDALGVLRSLLQKSPESFLPNLVLASTLQAIGRVKPGQLVAYSSESVVPLRAAAKARPTFALPHWQLAAVFTDLGVNETAAMEHQRATQLQYPDALPLIEAARKTIERAPPADDKALQKFLAIDQQLAESLSQDSWDLDYAAAAEALEKSFREYGMDVLEQSPPELQVILESRHAAVQQELKHWLVRWELYATAAKRPEVERLRALIFLDEDRWSQQFLAARGASNPTPLLELVRAAIPSTSLANNVLLIESLAVLHMLEKPDAIELLTRLRQSRGDSPMKFWIHLRDAQASLQQLSKRNGQKTGELADRSLSALSLALAQRPHIAALQSRLDQIRPLRPPTAERLFAEWTLSKGGYIQVWQPNFHEWVRVPVYRIDGLPSGTFRISGASLSNCDIGDLDLKQIPALPNLQRIYLDGTKVTDAGIRDWLSAFPSLNLLSLERTSVSNKVLPALANVERLFARKTRITPQGVAELATKFPKLIVLHDGTMNDTSAGVAFTASGTDFALEFGPRSQMRSKVRISSQQPFTIETRLRYRATLAFNNPWIVGLYCEDCTPTPPLMDLIAIEFTENEQASFASFGWVRGWAGAVSAPLRTTIYPDRMLHLAGVSDKRFFRTFVDGRLVKEIAISPYEFEGDHDLYVGTHAMVAISEFAQQDFSFHGALDEIRLSSVARYTTDFTPALRHEPDKHTIALYHFDEGEGEVAHDASGNDNHGKIVGAKWVRADALLE